ncbi:glycoside hydrolase family 16 protein [Rickenella mellea]|uniref:Glycoside hydrolase family 16 protein n=1 Tax=Rickenella mellea TaxID=50990 RepID=A0A4Y7PI73_9AGAM|nr:glycoside hydrolase family 16 protein [Rickenella mellea]
MGCKTAVVVLYSVLLIRHVAGTMWNKKSHRFYGKSIEDNIKTRDDMHSRCPVKVSSKTCGGNGSVSTGARQPTSAVSVSGMSTKAYTTTDTIRISPGATPTLSSASVFQLEESWSGNNFFLGWNFWDSDDPTHGSVEYVDQPTAQANNLVSMNAAGNAVIGVETTPQVAGNRRSVRITSSSSFTGGIFILDAVHVPTGCGTWPAFWTVGLNWPAGGEIDIVEGVNDNANNQVTLHTNPGCTLPLDFGTGNLTVGSSVLGSNCAAAETGNSGCGMQANNANTFGPGFNNNGGGVYASYWRDTGINVYFFPRNAIPSDITAGAPTPAQWGTPMATFPASQCPPSQFFYNHNIVIDTTLCGDWASGVWGTSGAPGQEQSCAQRTGVSTCEEFVRNNGSAFQQAYWEISSVKVYQSSRQP